MSLNPLGSLAAACTYGLLALLGLGIARLEIAQPLREQLPRAQAALAGECLPRVELPAGTAVSLAALPADRPAATASANTSAAAGKPAELRVTTLGPVELHLGEAPGAEGSAVDLSSRKLTLVRASGNFELRLRGADALVPRSDSTLLIHAPARFAPADDTDYVVETAASGAPKAAVKDGKFILAAGAELGSVRLVGLHSVTPLQPLVAAVWIADTPPTLAPLRVSGQPGLADLAIEAGRSNLRLDQQGVTVAACVLRPDLGDGRGSGWVRAGTTPPPAGSGAAGKLMLALPGAVLPSATDWQTPLWMVIASSDGRSLALGGIQVVGRVYAALGATLITALLLGALMYQRGQHVRGGDNQPRWFAGLFIGPDNDPSLSLLQVFIWTTITVWGFFYVFIVAGNLLSLTPEMMSLLGIAGAGTVAARWIAMSSGGSTSAAGATPATVAAGPVGGDFWRLLSTRGHFDLLKLQLFAFTAVIALYVVWRIADAAAFPNLDTNTLLLLGVSQGVYVTSKLGGGSDLAAVQALKAQIDAATTAAQDLNTRRQPLALRQAELQKKPQPLAAEETAELARLTTELAALDLQIQDNTSKTAALQADYDKGLLALGLKKA